MAFGEARVVSAAAATRAEPAAPEAPPAAVSVRDLVKSYGGTRAVGGVSFDVGRGEIFGLIGPDGAGKTTVFQILGGVMRQDAGSALVLGLRSRDARPFVGYLTQAFSLYPDLSAAENLRYVGALRRLPAREIEERGRRYLRAFDLDRFKDRLAGRLSGGMKQKLALACALVAEPKILLLDEPTTGVDPVSRREFWEALARLSSEGMTVVVATPYLDEAERCHRVALMHGGRLRQTGAPAELRHASGLTRLEVRAADLSRAEEVLRGAAGVEDVQRFGDRLDVMARDAARGERSVRGALGREGIAVTELRAREPTLENTFVSVLRGLEGEGRARPFPARRAKPEEKGGVAIEALDLRKTFGDFRAVNGVNIEVRRGEVYGLLGANGAGKTTTIKMLCGLVAPSGGRVTLAGERGPLRSSFARQRLGYMSQKFSLYDDLTVEENLDFFAGVYGVPRGEREEKKRWALSVAGLEGKGRMLTASLPGGWKQRVAFGAAVMHEPSVLFLDEPTSGVDPLARRAFWKMINSFADRGVAVLVTTHYLEEAEQCNRLGLMVAGEMVAEGSPSELKAAQPGTLIELQTDDPQHAADVLKAELERWRVSLFGDRLHVIADGGEAEAVRRLTGMLAGAGVGVRGAYGERFSLEDVFIQIVERARREGRVAPED
ncbi:MAG TPA: ATP-binding cassette domain-containing protein [Pyrinomonadaceae bacterium]